MADVGSMWATLGIRLQGITQAQRTMSTVLRGVSKEVDVVKSQLTEMSTTAQAQMGKTAASMEALPASLFSVTRAITALTTVVSKELQMLSANMLKVANSATIMGNATVTASKKIVTASKMASLESMGFAPSFGGKIAQGNANAMIISNARQQAEETGKKVKQTVQNTSNDVKKMPIVPIVDGTQAMKDIDKFTGGIFRSAQRWRTFGYLSSIILTAPMAMAGKAAIKTASDFDYSMAKIVGLVGMSRKSMEGFKQQILDMAPVVAQTPQKLAEAFYFITSAGFKDGAKAMEILETSAKMATSGMGETADIAKLLVFSMNAYKKTGLTAARAADVFTAAVREGAIEADGFSSAMQSVLPIASAMGIGIEQVAGSMAAMSLQGATAANSAVYLKGMLNSLLKIKPGSGAADALAEFGVTAEDLYATLKKPGGLLKVLVQLQDLSNRKGGNMFLKEIFRDIRAMTGALSLVGENLEYNEQVMQKVAAAYGDAGRSFFAVSDEMKVRIDRMKATMDVIKTGLGENLSKIVIPALEGLVRTLKNVTDAFNGLSDGTQKAIIQVLGLVAALGPLALIGSVIKYMYAGMAGGIAKTFTFLTTAIKGATGSFGSLKKAMTISPFWTKAIFNLTKFFKGLGIVGGTSFGILATAAVTGTVALFKYSKKIKDIAKENDAFNKTILNVNDSLVKMNELMSTDIEAMDMVQLSENRKKLLPGIEQEGQEVLQRQINMDMPLQSNRLNKKQYEEHLQHLFAMTKAYDDMGAAMDAWANRFEANAKAQQKAKDDASAEKLKVYNEELQDSWNKMLANIAAAEKMAKANGTLRASYDLVGAKVKIWMSELEELFGEKFKLNFDDPKVKQLLIWLKTAGYDFTEVGQKSQEFVKDLNSSLASINLKKDIVPNFDYNTSMMETYKKAMEEYAEILTKVDDITGVIQAPTQEQLANLKEYTKQYERWKIITEEAADEKILSFLNEQAKAFGGVDNQVEVLNAQLQIAERKLRQLGEAEGFSENFKKQADAVNELRDALYRLNEEADIQYLVDMNKAMDNSNSQMNLLDGLMSALEQRLQNMSRAGYGASQAFQDMADKLKTLNRVKEAVDILGDAFERVFRDMLEGGKNFSEIMVDIFKDLVAKIMAELAKAMVFKIIMAIATRGASIPGSVMVAKGGVIPPGYPNDSYPAMLTSGETVLPKKLTPDMFKSNDNWSGQVVFEISQDKLVGILQKAVKKNSIY